VDLGDERTGGIEDRQAAHRGFLLDAPGDTVGAEDGDGVRRHFRQALDEDRALVLQAFDHVFVMDDLVAHINRRAILLERALDDLDGTHHARAKSAGLCQKHFHGMSVTQIAPNSFWVLRTIRISAISAPRPASVHMRLNTWTHRALCQKTSA
jgi:hypothetical protein